MIVLTHQLQHAMILVMVPDKSINSRTIAGYRSFDCLHLLRSEMSAPAGIPPECFHEILEGAPELHVVGVQTRPGGYDVSVSGATPSGYASGPSGNSASGGAAGPDWGHLLSNPQQTLYQGYSGALSGVAGSGGADDGRYRVDLGEYQTAQGRPTTQPLPGGLLGPDVSLWPARPDTEGSSFLPVEHEACGVGEFCDPSGHVMDHGYENPTGVDILERMGEDNANMEAATLQLPSLFFDDILGDGGYVVNPEDFHTAFGWLGDAWPSAFAGLDFGWGGLGGYFEEVDPNFTFDFLGSGFVGFGFDSLGFGGFDFSGGW